MPKYLLVILIILTACSQKTNGVAADQVTYRLDQSRISVSGVSSGAYMAAQLHLAHSALFAGVAIIAGGPYYCAQGELSVALGPCMKGGDFDSEALMEYVRVSASSGKIDELSNLEGDRAWVFHGMLDSAVDQSLSAAAAAMYRSMISADNVTLVTDIAAVHGLPTISSGSPCDTFAAPFLNACDYDAAGEILRTLHGPLNERGTANGSLRSIVQPGFDAASMMEHAYLYVPTSCTEAAACGVHVAVHGCSQSAELVGDAFARGAGFNEWADANRLLVLYPQVASSQVAPMNPYGCWDWWGYTGENYATKEGAQITVVKATLDALAGTTL